MKRANVSALCQTAPMSRLTAQCTVTTETEPTVKSLGVNRVQCLEEYNFIISTSSNF